MGSQICQIQRKIPFTFPLWFGLTLGLSFSNATKAQSLDISQPSCKIVLESVETGGDSAISEVAIKGLLTGVTSMPHSPDRQKARMDGSDDPIFSAVLDYFSPKIRAAAAKKFNHLGRTGKSRLIEREDLESAGHKGLLLAWDGFSPSQGSQALGYFMVKIKGAMTDTLRGFDHLDGSTIEKYRVRRLVRSLEIAAEKLTQMGQKWDRDTWISSAAEVLTARNKDPDAAVTLPRLIQALETAAQIFFIHSKPPARESELSPERGDEPSTDSVMEAPLAIVEVPEIETEEITQNFHSSVLRLLHRKSDYRRLIKIYRGRFIEGQTLARLAQQMRLSESAVS